MTESASSLYKTTSTWRARDLSCDLIMGAPVSNSVNSILKAHNICDGKVIRGVSSSNAVFKKENSLSLEVYHQDN